ncbi:MAG TPA: BamA/TamA family outer membrane protein [Usitatibacteraceae bacterium]|nr:BamA/TamA family outer membrane protein [Usitatibacteraceae bacterium]
MALMRATALLRRCLAAATLPCLLWTPFAAWSLPGDAERDAQAEIDRLEKAGASIRAIHVHTGDIFDLDNPAENNALFRLANWLHIETRPELVRRALLFREGQRLSRQRIEETERQLRNLRFLYDVQIRAIAVDGNQADIEVRTRDTWSLNASASGSRAGGASKTSVEISEVNFLGSGTSIGLAHKSDFERKGRQWEIGHPRLLDGHTELRLLSGSFNDGSRRYASLIRPFESLDGRWSAGVQWDDQDRIDSRYEAGELVAEYRRRARRGELLGAISGGLIDGTTRRIGAGFLLADDHYRLEPGRTPPLELPVDQNTRAPFVRLEWLEDRFLRTSNRDLIGRPEFLDMGTSVRLQVARSVRAFGATRADWLLEGAVRRGFEPRDGHNLLVQGAVARRPASTGSAYELFSAQARYFVPQGGNWLLYSSAALDWNRNGGRADQYYLGGNNGLRGYPARYLSGQRRALATIEQRYYSDAYPFRLFRVGAVAFLDAGRAWGGTSATAANRGWLADAGFGLRISLDRAAFANVLHLDVARPLRSREGIKSHQFLARTEFNF